MAHAAIPLSVADSKKAIRHIFPQLGGVAYSDGLTKSRRLKWTHPDVKVLNKLSAELDELGINHQLIIPDPAAFNTWRGPSIAIHVSKALDYRAAVTGLVNPHKLKKNTINVRFTTLDTKCRILDKLVPYVSGDDVNLSAIELVQMIHDRVKEDLS